METLLSYAEITQLEQQLDDLEFDIYEENLGELYDLREDPFENLNLYSNAQYVTVKDRLTRELAGWRKRTS